MVTNATMNLSPYLEQEVSGACTHVTYIGTSMKEDN